MGLFFSGEILGDIVWFYVVYVGLPERLSLGLIGGETLPLSCQASLKVEGGHGYPCTLARFLRGILGI